VLTTTKVHPPCSDTQNGNVCLPQTPLVLQEIKKVKGRLAGSSALQLLVSLLYPTPNTVVPSFISRGAIAPSGARALC
jgi:hypothetical protein